MSACLPWFGVSWPGQEQCNVCLLFLLVSLQGAARSCLPVFMELQEQQKEHKELSAAAVATWPGSKGTLSHFICSQGGGNPPGEQFQRSDACAGLSFLPH